MPAIPAFTLTTVFFFAAVLFLTGLIGTAVLGAFESWLEARQRRSDIVGVSSDHRHCRYCRWGNAILREESVRFEDLARVTVRTYVCGSCGLPQWFIQRAPVGHYAEP